nr:peroxisomal (S)-2-hydroxy-acid oxidase GLO4-like [Tanacetum cinerariifolium]
MAETSIDVQGNGCAPTELQVKQYAQDGNILGYVAMFLWIGHPVFYRLDSKKEYGARRVMEMFKDELEVTMVLFDYTTLDHITSHQDA